MYVNEEWVYNSGVGSELDWASSVFDVNGDLIVVGNRTMAPGNSDVLITKYNQEGAVLWQQSFDGAGNSLDYGVKALSNASGDIYVACALTGAGTEFDMGLLKYNTNGSLLWSTAWNGPDNLIDAPTCMILHPSGAVYMAGITHATLTDINYALLKVSPGGQVLWSASYDHAGFSDIVAGIELDAAYNPVLTGASANAANDWDYATVSYAAASGSQLAVSRVVVPGLGLDRATAIGKDANANLYITGYSESNGIKELQTIKLDAAFNLEWNVSFQGAGLADVARAIDTDASGNIYITGSTANTNGGADIVTIKYDDQGNEMWARRYKADKPTFTAEGSKLFVDADGNCLVTGTLGNGSDRDFITVAYASNGKLMWARSYDGGHGDDAAKDIISDPQGNIYITGLSNTGTGAEYTTLKYHAFVNDRSYVLDANGDPLCTSNEVIIKFDPRIVDRVLIDETAFEAGQLGEFVPATIVNAIANAIGNETSAGDLMAYKIYRNLSTHDSLSISRLGVEVPIPAFWSSLLVSSPSMSDPLLAAAAISQLAGVYYAEPNYVYRLDGIPNDQYINAPTDLQPNLVPTAAVPNAHINASAAWDIQTGSEDIQVGVIDDGIYHQHADLQQPVPLLPKGFQGWDYVNWGSASNWDPEANHGTAVAGIIGAVRDNSIGIAGLAGGSAVSGNYGSQIYSLDVSYNGYNLTAANAASALAKGCAGASDPAGSGNLGFGYGLDIINNSWGGPAVSHEVQQQVYFCLRNHVVVTASKGNSVTGAVPSFTFPADLNEEWLVAVGGSGDNGSWVSGFNGSNNMWEANYGGHLDLVAPATENIVMSTIKDPATFSPPLAPQCGTSYSEYGCFDGLSAATPHVSGVAALMLSEHNIANGAPNNLAPEDVEQVLEATATDVGPPGYDAFNGHGRLDAGAAVAKVHYPVYHVWHQNGPPISSSQVQGAQQQIQLFVHDDPSLVHGDSYEAYPITVSHEYFDQFPADIVIIDHWGRISSGGGIGPAVSGQVHDWAQIDMISASFPAPNQAEITIEAVCWYIIEDMNGDPVNKWLPHHPDSIETHYSLHLHDTEIVGIGEQDELSNDLVLFPSPAHGLLNIQWGSHAKDPRSILIMDAIGRVVLQERSPGGEEADWVVQIDRLSTGTYFVQVRSGDTQVHGKFLKY